MNTKKVGGAGSGAEVAPVAGLFMPFGFGQMLLSDE